MDRNTSPKITIKPRKQPAEGQWLRSSDHQVMVGDWELGRGVLDFKLEMPAGSRPKATITFYPESVDVEVAAAGVQIKLLDDTEI